MCKADSTMNRLLIAVLMIVLASCSDSETQSVERSELPPLGAPFNCEDPPFVVDSLPVNFSEFAGVMALPNAVDKMQRGRSGPDNDLDSRRAFSKMGLFVRPGLTFQIHVGAGSQGNALIHWGNAGSDDPVSSIAVGGCEGDDGTWLGYPGGVWTLDPACVELLVATVDERAQVLLPIGASCP